MYIKIKERWKAVLNTKLDITDESANYKSYIMTAATEGNLLQNFNFNVVYQS